jgi:ribosomal protein L9
MGKMTIIFDRNENDTIYVSVYNSEIVECIDQDGRSVNLSPREVEYVNSKVKFGECNERYEWQT